MRDVVGSPRTCVAPVQSLYQEIAGILSEKRRAGPLATRALKWGGVGERSSGHGGGWTVGERTC